MKYLIVQDWDNTKGNHAGMSHMCDLLIEKYPDEYVKIAKGCPPPMSKRNIFFSRMMGWYDRMVWKKKWQDDYMKICEPMFGLLNPGDEIYLLEYNWPWTSQYQLAQYIRRNFPNIKIRTLSHITPTLYKSIKAEKFIPKWCSVVDTVMTMGHDLSNYFHSVGVPLEKLSTGFHYVDNEYYKVDISHIKESIRPTVIVMGALQRNFQMLADIVNSTPNVNWIICKGKKDVGLLFQDSSNIRLVGYIQEDELRSLMASSDISLNVLEDTVGSNVITTSMAMGLAIIVSDVGSIRDHVDESNAIFCQNTKESFIEALNNLSSAPSRIVEMRKASVEKVKNISIEKVHGWFSNL